MQNAAAYDQMLLTNIEQVRRALQPLAALCVHLPSAGVTYALEREWFDNGFACAPPVDRAALPSLYTSHCACRILEAVC